MAWLVSLNGDHLGKWYSLDAPCLVGRASLNHVVIDDPRISRQHAKIAQEEDGYIVYDLGSANGTFVDDEPVKRQRLEHGATLRFGPFSFSFKETRERARTVPLPPVSSFGGSLEVRTLSGLAAPIEILDSRPVITDPDESTSLVVLEEAYRKLSLLHAFMRALAASLDIAGIVDTILAHLLETFTARDVTIYVFDEGSDAIEGLRAIASCNDEGRPVPPRALANTIFEEVVRRGHAVLTVTPARLFDEERRPMMHAPMMRGAKVLGVIAIGDTAREEPYRQRDLDLLGAMGVVAGLTVHNARLHEAEVRRQRIEADLALAREIQASFLPRTLPSAPRVELAAEYRPVYSIGGDVYDALWLDDRRLGLFVGDVAGKGIAAALQMARVTSDLRVAVRAASTPAAILSHVNQVICERGQTEVFVTGVFVSLDVETGKAVVANAGHCPPLVRGENGEVRSIGDGSAALGFFRETAFVEVEVALAPGDTLVLCTDGVIEAQGRNDEAYGERRLMRALAHAREPARQIADDLLDDLGAHLAGAALGDDLTLIVCRFK